MPPWENTLVLQVAGVPVARRWRQMSIAAGDAEVVQQLQAKVAPGFRTTHVKEGQYEKRREDPNNHSTGSHFAENLF